MTNFSALTTIQDSTAAMTETNQTRENMIDSAEKLFWIKGYKATSIDDIVADAGQSKGAFFHYFKSKKDVTLLALEKYAREEIFLPIDMHFNQHKSIKEFLLSWAHEKYREDSLRNHKGGCMLGSLAQDFADTDKDIRELCLKLFLEWENLLVSHFRGAEKTGTLLMEPRQFARVIIANYQGLMLSIKTHKDKNRAGRDFQAFAELLERLIKD